jgi:hypothetical protein
MKWTQEASLNQSFELHMVNDKAAVSPPVLRNAPISASTTCISNSLTFHIPSFPNIYYSCTMKQLFT